MEGGVGGIASKIPKACVSPPSSVRCVRHRPQVRTGTEAPPPHLTSPGKHSADWRIGSAVASKSASPQQRSLSLFYPTSTLFTHTRLSSSVVLSSVASFPLSVLELSAFPVVCGAAFSVRMLSPSSQFSSRLGARALHTACIAEVTHISCRAVSSWAPSPGSLAEAREPSLLTWPAPPMAPPITVRRCRTRARTQTRPLAAVVVMVVEEVVVLLCPCNPRACDALWSDLAY